MNYISKFKKNQYEGKKYVEKAKASSENDEAFVYADDIPVSCQSAGSSPLPMYLRLHAA